MHQVRFRSAWHFLLLAGFSLIQGQSLAQIDFNLPQKPVKSEVRFDRFTTADGLTGNDVISVYQDRFGYFWFGTLTGLNKFDGYDFEVFHFSPGDSTSISSDIIECFAEDPFGYLWIGTSNGLNRYNRMSNSFQHYFHNPSDTNSLGGNHIRSILVGKDSVMWVETFEGTLNRVDLKTLSVRRFSHSAASQPYYHYHTIYEDRRGKLWLGGREMGILQFDKSTKKIRTLSVSSSDPTKKRERDVACYFEDSRNNFWVSGYDGVYLFDPVREIFRKVLSTSTWSIAEDREGTLWFGTGHGVLSYNPASGILFSYNHDPGDKKSLSGDHVYKVFIDANGSVWIATEGGLNRLSRKPFNLTHYTHKVGKQSTLASDKVTCAIEDPDGLIWIGTMGGGLNRFDPSNEKFTVYRNLPGIHGALASDKISALYIDRESRLWIGLWAGIGFQEFIRDQNRFRTYRYDKTSFKFDWYNAFAEDTLGNFYIGYWGGTGLTLFDRKNFRVIKSLKDFLIPTDPSRLVECLLLDSGNDLWIGTTTAGLYRYTPHQGTSLNFQQAPGDSGSLQTSKVSCLLEDRAGNLWIGGGGLNVRMSGSRSFIHLSKDDGLIGDDVMGILEDMKGNIWASTKNGISKFNLKTRKFTNFSSGSGFPEIVFSKACSRLSSGKLLFGGNGGFIIYNPDSLVAQDTPKLVINHFSIFEKERISDLCETRTIRLTYNENFFSFNFASPDNLIPEKAEYEYRLLNFSNTWITAKAQSRKAVFTNVPPGNYLFEVRIKDLLSGKTKITQNIQITITPPFWQRWWFYTLEIMAFVCVIVLIIGIREARLKAKNRSIELKQKLLRSQMNPHFIFNSLFAIQNYIYEHKTDEAGRFLSSFAALIRLILDNSRLEFIPLDKEIETLQLYLQLQSLRFENKFSYTLFIDPEIDTELTGIPPMLAQPFIENALEHGIRNITGMGQLDISFGLNDDLICFELKDNGIGLKTAEISHSEKARKHKSLAMEITRERIQLLNKRLKKEIRLEIFDRSDDEERQTGTIIRFKIPYMDVNPH